MNANKAYGNIEIYCPDGNLMFRTNDKKLRSYKKNNLVEEIGDNKFRLLFQPKGLGHYSRNKVHLVPRINQCVRCGYDDILVLTRHHIVPTRFRKHLPEYIKSNNHRYVVFLCRECHNEYGYFENDLNEKLAEDLNIKSLYQCKEEQLSDKKLVSGIANAILNNSNIPEDRKEELKTKFVSMTGLEADENNLVKVCKWRYEVINETNDFGKLVVDNIRNIYEFQQLWLEHFVETMNPKHLPEDLLVLL